ncbi:MAG: peptidase S41, partial [bacterium]
MPNDGVAMRPSRISVAKNIENYGLSPKGERAVFCARGDIFTAPIEKGATRNLTNSSNAHDKWPAWSPDGKKIAFISDRSGEEEIYIIDQDGKGEPEQLTNNGHEMRFLPKWSPDGKYIAFTDKNGKIWVLDVATKKMKEIADEKSNWTFDYNWSPNGGYIAIAMQGENGFGSIYIWSAAEDKLHRVTGPIFNEWNPVWDPKGDYLYYLSDREFAPQIGSIEWNYVVDRETGIYALSLRKDVKNPFPFESDEVKIEEEKKDENGKKEDAAAEKDDKEKKEDKDKKEEEKKEPIKIDFDGLDQRVVKIPVEADNYYGMDAIDGHLIYVRGRAFYYGRQSDVKPEIQIFSMEDREENTLAKDAGGFEVSRDGKKLLTRSNGAFKLYDAKPKPGDPKTVSTAGLVVDRIPAEEWTEI